MDTPDNTSVENGELYGVLAEFDTPGALIKAARKVRDAGYTEFDCYSPFPVHGIDEAMGIKRTILPLLIFGGGITGLLGGCLLQWYCNASAWHWNVSGKPLWTFPITPNNVPIAFECTILLSVFTSFFGMWILNKLPQVWHPFFRLDRFAKVTDDGFFLGIEAKDKRFDLAETRRLLESAGALEVEDCNLDPDPETRRMPIWLYGFIIVSTVFALVPFALIYRARASHSKEPHYHIFSDMDFQAKVKSDTAFDMFPDGRANRGEIPGTVARGWLEDDSAYWRGLTQDQGGEWITNFPAQVQITPELMKRGQQRFNIYCAPCHGYDGRGDGMIPQRVRKAGAGALLPRNLIDPKTGVITMPNGQVFNTISNGYNTMMGYSAQIPAQDRWAIVAYVRALERAQNAAQGDVPADKWNEINGATP
ncbi:MAG TPA: quinol:electron acceptor oxidoreductase subunit ActD [Kofleriaceae bacterium]|jgi:mono/diheme cytochrome c family protein|nr:quinol:electron acceptor oxidoreductase subunit ActD [Kofleriaceae bacterium]